MKSGMMKKFLYGRLKPGRCHCCGRRTFMGLTLREKGVVCLSCLRLVDAFLRKEFQVGESKPLKLKKKMRMPIARMSKEEIAEMQGSSRLNKKVIKKRKKSPFSWTDPD